MISPSENEPDWRKRVDGEVAVLPCARKEYTLVGGRVLTEEDFERMADDAAAGDYPGTPGRWVVRPQGRPAISDEELVTIAFKVPRSQREAADRKAASMGETRSQFMRDALDRALAVG